MSNYETRVGSIKPTKLTVDELVTEWAATHTVPKYYTLPEDNFEVFRDELGNSHILLGDVAYEILHDKDLEDYDLFELTENPGGTLNYILRYYNGGCDYHEALETAFNNMNKGNK